MKNENTYKTLLNFKLALECQLFHYKRIASENPEIEPRIEDLIGLKESQLLRLNKAFEEKESILQEILEVLEGEGRGA